MACPTGVWSVRMNRRAFVTMLSAAGASTAVRIAGAQAAGAQAAGDQSTPTLYFADGYHGGVKGHMPAGAWRDILNTMRDVPRWKLCLDIEAATWEVLLRD